MATEQYDVIVNALSDLIRQAVKEQAREERHPGYSSDEMDDVIKAARERAEDLRAVRHQMERIEAGWRGQEVKIHVNPIRDFDVIVEREIARGA